LSLLLLRWETTTTTITLVVVVSNLVIIIIIIDIIIITIGVELNKTLISLETQTRKGGNNGVIMRLSSSVWTVRSSGGEGYMQEAVDYMDCAVWGCWYGDDSTEYQ